MPGYEVCYEGTAKGAGDMEFRRKNIRLPQARYIGRQWYFLTACAQGRRARFCDRTLVSEVLKLLYLEAAKHSFVIEAYCFMPDHLHLLVSGTSETSDCLVFLNAFKQKSAFAFKKAFAERLWQHKTYDHILRCNERWEGVACYIWNNPVRKGLCSLAEYWPCSGSQSMDWKRLLSGLHAPWLPPWKQEM